MSPRRRSTAKRGWPRNLYERDGYYSWRHPKTREEFGLGRDKHAAFTQAIEANLHLQDIAQKPRLIHRLTGEADRTVAAWNEKYQAMLAGQDLAPNTIKVYRSMGKRLVALLGEQPCAAVTPLMVSAAIDAVVAEGRNRTAQALRSYMRDAFREARVAGWCDLNPVLDTKMKVKVVVQRSRLTLEAFQAILAAAPQPFVKNAMLLALVSGQRREDVAGAQFKDIRDGHWFCLQGKTKARVAIPLSIRLDAIGMSLADVVAACRRTGVVSRYLVHQTEGKANSPIGSRLFIDTLSKRFGSAAIATALSWDGKGAPTFHEIRSLSARLYGAQGGIDVQQLLGHRHAETTALYRDDRGLGWTTVSVGK